MIEKACGTKRAIFYFPHESERASRKQFGVRKRVCKISDSYRLGATYSIVTQIRDSAYCVSKYRIRVYSHRNVGTHTAEPATEKLGVKRSPRYILKRDMHRRRHLQTGIYRKISTTITIEKYGIKVRKKLQFDCIVKIWLRVLSTVKFRLAVLQSFNWEYC